METTESEIYPNAPIEFVACEVQFPVSPSLGNEDVLRTLSAAFFDWLPLVQPEVETTLLVGPVPQQPPLVSQQLRFLSRDRRFGVVVSTSRVSIETTNYPGWDQFRGLVARALSTVADVAPNIPGITRVGLRYIDEIRVPDPGSDQERWVRYVDARLSGAATVLLEGQTAMDMQAALQFDLGGGHSTVVRYGARRGQAVGDTPLRRRQMNGPSGEYFLFDVDGFWAPGDELPEFSVDGAMSTADRLHEPVRALFESSITDALREILRRAPSNG
jgi:uncharacterized protein (TIGR04255 family)